MSKPRQVIVENNSAFMGGGGTYALQTPEAFDAAALESIAKNFRESRLGVLRVSIGGVKFVMEDEK
jgi:hypothetical protein